MSALMKSFLISAAALAVAASGAPARAGGDHVMTVQLPDGGVARIAYTGDVPPQVVLPAAAPGAGAAFWPAPAFMAPGFGMAPGFAALEQVSDAMEREADAMLRQAAAMPALTRADFGSLPAGVQIYSVESTITGNGACTRRTEISYASGSMTPREISSETGDCGQAPRRVATPASNDRSRLIRVRAQDDYRHLVKDATWRSHS